MSDRVTFVDDAVEDAIISLIEQEVVLPDHIDVWYPEAEWALVEKLHRLKINQDRKLVLVKDRYPFIRVQILGITVNLAPGPNYTETIH